MPGKPFILAAVLAVPALMSGAPAAAMDETAVPQVAAAPVLTEIDYKLLYRRMMQLGMLSQVLGYTLSVDDKGEATDCRFSRRFKSRYTREQLCEAFRDATGFQPARDAQGIAVAGTYEGEVEVASFFQPSR
jgi:hypothetical protein